MYNLSFIKFEKSDFPDYYQLVSNEQVMAQITERAIPLEEAKADYEKLLKRNKLHDLFGSFRIMDAGNYIGLGHLTRNEENEEEAEIGYMILPAFWGKRYGTEIAKKLVNKAEQTSVRKLTAIIDPANAASKKILTKLDFVTEKICKIDGLPGEILGKKLGE
ncbi:GNAT family N-acetyltransferase [Sutcliffiella rhizosphaerae]|uniref:N-acetyltransferase domain-containing protein n=1 Tax=Sutcliffiella rhizosphaerae TaxID=2880967 RepID=A0ABM8YJX7_9BACI|nr:GNAT family N-acetyltransferase [Sutcliffiella rhizosphaerae]CAG9620177.1 hypothetical protein BACCIP111883_00945 [Sutcliffiella rhizosphaerae]